MSENSLAKRMSILYDMEINNYLMTRNLQNIDIQKSKLGHKRNIYCPKKKENEYSFVDYLLVGGNIGAVIGGIFGLIFGFVSEDGFFAKIFNAIGEMFVFGIIGAIISGVIGLVVGIIVKANEQQKIDAKFAKDLQEYERALANDRARVEREKQEITFLNNQQIAIEKKLCESERLLKTFYESVGIDESYRNIVPIGYMNQFMKLGISTKLEGVDGLYYLIRQELRADQLQYTLETISNKLDIIIDQQSEMYRELIKINRKCDDMVRTLFEQSKTMNKSLKSIEKNTSITAYNSERIAKEASYLTTMIALGNT